MGHIISRCVVDYATLSRKDKQRWGIVLIIINLNSCETPKKTLNLQYLHPSKSQIVRCRKTQFIIAFIVRALRCPFCFTGLCEGLKSRSEQSVLLHAIFYSQNVGHKTYTMHIGKMIRDELDRQPKKHTVTWFATQLCCNRRNVYDIFERPYIDTALLERICIILNHDFFLDISRGLSLQSTEAEGE